MARRALSPVTPSPRAYPEDMDNSPAQTAAEVADWRIATFQLYAQVRELALTDPEQAHRHWRQGRDRLFGGHPASALNAAQKAAFSGLTVADYDPGFRFVLPLEATGAGQEMRVNTGTDGVVSFVRLGTFDIPGVGALAAWKLQGYGGGIFLPFRDGSSGNPGGSYGAGRYLLDTIKGAHLGGQDGSLVLDFNFAYNPSCAYDEAWACPLPGPDNRLEKDIPVGELYAPELGA
jgi:uncharacterized protein (DUF1684 family)